MFVAVQATGEKLIASKSLGRLLDPPSYGFERKGVLYHPTKREILSEFFHRLNIFKNKKNWVQIFSWITSLSFAIPLAIFFTYFFSFKLVLCGFIYSMVVLGSFGTFWFHRYATHRAFKFRNAFLRNISRNLVIKVMVDEVYVISHHVHHQISELPGDPYNVYCGWLYCFLADVNHQAVARDLSPKDYLLLCDLLRNTGVHCNSYEQYQKWGSICHPAWTILHYILNWSFWYAIFFLVGGNALATALFGFAGVWAIGVRTFNYEGHGRGKDRRKTGSDFNTEDISINQLWPGFVAGEWHSNHHLYPSSARSGFLSYQLDLPWFLIKAFEKLRIISSFRDDKKEFLKMIYDPYKKSKKGGLEGEKFLSTDPVLQVSPSSELRP